MDFHGACLSGRKIQGEQNFLRVQEGEKTENFPIHERRENSERGTAYKVYVTWYRETESGGGVFRAYAEEEKTGSLRPIEQADSGSQPWQARGDEYQNGIQTR